MGTAPESPPSAGDRRAAALIRPLRDDDIPAVALLMTKVYPDQQWASQGTLEAYLHEMLFDVPWRDPELHSLIAESEGEVVGFQALVPRPMRLHGRALRVAVSCQFMIDPDKRHGLTALQLIKTCFAGPQDLTIADGANEVARRVWVGLGGQSALLYSMHWTRPLRPATLALSLLHRGRSRPQALHAMTRPISGLLDGVAARLRPNRFHRQDAQLSDEPLQPVQMLRHLPEAMSGNALQPVYDEAALTWLLDQANRKTRHGAMRARAVVDTQRRLLGWFLYYWRRGGPAEVLQIAARHGHYDAVFRRLLRDAWRHGCTALRGRLDPHYAQELSDRHCWLRREGSFTLFHSRHADVCAALHRGDAFLSRLEGEWWMRFHGV
jgi:hypothetical protein